MFTNSVSIVVLQLFNTMAIYLVCLGPIFLPTACRTFNSALLLLTKFLQADEHRFRSAAVSGSPKSNNLLANSAISSYLQVCWASFVIRVNSYFDLVLSESNIQIFAKIITNISRPKQWPSRSDTLAIFNGIVYFFSAIIFPFATQSTPYIKIVISLIEQLRVLSLKMENNSFTPAQIETFMDLALSQASAASLKNEVPVGCVFVDNKGNSKTSSHNLTNRFKNATRHCEINCIEKLTQEKVDFSQLELFVTVEPCVMCTYALNLVRIKKVYFGQFNQRFGGCGSVMTANQFAIEGGIKEKESLSILKSFYERGNQNLPEEQRNKSRKRIKKQNDSIQQ